LISAEEAARTAAFLAAVAERIAVAEPLVPEPTETFPEAYYNEELARMVEAPGGLRGRGPAPRAAARLDGVGPTAS
jgi:hypothetical protein